MSCEMFEVQIQYRLDVVYEDCGDDDDDDDDDDDNDYDGDYDDDDDDDGNDGVCLVQDVCKFHPTLLGAFIPEPLDGME